MNNGISEYSSVFSVEFVNRSTSLKISIRESHSYLFAFDFGIELSFQFIPFSISDIAICTCSIIITIRFLKFLIIFMIHLLLLFINTSKVLMTVKNVITILGKCDY